MKYIFYILNIIVFNAYSQKTDSIKIPKGVTYHYQDPELVKNAEVIIRKELGKYPDYKILDHKLFFIGPILWSRYKEVNTLSNIPGGNTTLLVDDEKLSAKVTQNLTDAKKVWDYLSSEINNNILSIRKVNYKELQYYWSVIPFDIDEPLLIIETSKHKYILNLDPKTMKLIWLDEVPTK